jgi:hypothetical protein
MSGSGDGPGTCHLSPYLLADLPLQFRFIVRSAEDEDLELHSILPRRSGTTEIVKKTVVETG